MPYKANEAPRHKIPRARYKVSNWPENEPAIVGVALAEMTLRYVE